MKRIRVDDYKTLIRELHDVDNYPMNAVVRYDADFNIELTSDLYPENDMYTLGRACDVSEWLGYIYDETLTENLNSINIKLDDDYLVQGYIVITPMTINENNRILMQNLEEKVSLIPKFMNE